MSTHRVEVVKYHLEPHLNADSLSIAHVKGWQCVVRTSEFSPEGIAGYIPIGMRVPDLPEWEFLRTKGFRIRTVKLRGAISQGLLVPPRPGWVEGQDVTEELGAYRYEVLPEVQVSVMNSDSLPDDPRIPHYTGIENWNNYPDVIKEGDYVIITEKIHGANARFAMVDGEFFVGSHHYLKKFDERNTWWIVAKSLGIEDSMRKRFPSGHVVLFGEIFGKVQKLRYGIPGGLDFRSFDLWKDGSYCSYLDMQVAANALGVEPVPVLKTGNFSLKDLELRNGEAFRGGHEREGIVIRPVREKWDPCLGRVILKSISEEYLLREG